jgi:hypothetical protein
MKNIFKIIIIAITVISYSSCSEGDLLIDEVSDGVDTTSGAVLRFLEVPDVVINLSGNPPLTNNLNFLLEVQEGDGSFQPDFTEVRVSIEVFANSALDVPILDFDGNVVEILSYVNIDSSLFDTLSDNNGLPQYSLETSSQELLDLFPTADFPNTIYVSTTFRLVMADGTIFDDVNSAGTVGGAFFNSPFFRKTALRRNL